MSANPQKMYSWLTLNDEFDAWAEENRTATLWWRDDDAVAPGPKLDRLIDLTATTGLLLAVIPARAQKALALDVAAAPHVQVAQHGYAHTNHAPRGQGLGAWELGLHRGMTAVLADLDTGRKQIETLFGDRFSGIVVPPWNRIDPALFDPMAARGYRGISVFGPRATRQPATDFQLVNAHFDPIRWRAGAKFTGESRVLSQLQDHLRARRKGTVDANEPSGLLTHHIDLDPAGWDFCARLAEIVQNHRAARWCSTTEVFKPSL